MSLKAKVILIFIIIALAVFAIWFFYAGVETVAIRVKKQDAVKGITVTGNVKSTEDVDVTAEVTSIIEKILVSTGADVVKGQVLAQLDTSEIIGKVEAAKARVKTAEAQLKRERVELEDAILDEKRYKKLYELGAVSKREYEERELRRERLEEIVILDKKQIDVAEGELGSIKATLELYTIRASVSGIIADKFISTGDLVSPQQPLFRLVSPEDIYLSVEVEEDELDEVELGQNALVIFDAYPEKVFEGKIFLISRQVNPLTGTFEARITKPDENKFKVLVGMTLDATIILEEFQDVMIIPADFVEIEQNKSYVYKNVGSFALRNEIESKIFDNNRVIVTKGLNVGDVILKRVGTGKLKDNQKVKIKEFKNEKVR